MRKRIEDISILTIVSFSFVFAVIILASVAFGAYSNDDNSATAPAVGQSGQGGDSQATTGFEKEFSQIKASLFAPQTVFINVGGNTQRVSFRLTSPDSIDQEVAADSSPAVTLLQIVSPANESVATVDETASVAPADNQVTANTNLSNTTNASAANAPATNSSAMPASVASALPDSDFDYTGLSLNQLNWCYPGQPWGNGFCNDAGLTPFEVERWWTCGWYWAHWDLGFISLSDVPLWCGGDSDGDGTPDGGELCPHDANKTDPGICGCGIADTDTDGDGTPDCVDYCIFDPGKTAPGICGCGTPDSSDTDGDLYCPPIDQCEGDPGKIAPGICGCGTPESNNVDGDSACPPADQCEGDPNKLVPGICGCGFAESTNVDGDSACPNNGDSCEGDPNKLIPGTCGCGIPDVDTDGDGTLDCNDFCPVDPSKTTPGVCGCNYTEFYCLPGVVCGCLANPWP